MENVAEISRVRPLQGAEIDNEAFLVTWENSDVTIMCLRSDGRLQIPDTLLVDLIDLLIPLANHIHETKNDASP